MYDQDFCIALSRYYLFGSLKSEKNGSHWHRVFDDKILIINRV